ncbi:MAG TPA: hypothetical protein VFJ58_29235 [Armatimonadota bacterium]|nr:hypothetical protein [Armatimonadota bacterium]
MAVRSRGWQHPTVDGRPIVLGLAYNRFYDDVKRQQNRGRLRVFDRDGCGGWRSCADP